MIALDISVWRLRSALVVTLGIGPVVVVLVISPFPTKPRSV